MADLTEIIENLSDKNRDDSREEETMKQTNTWNLSALFKSDDAPEMDKQRKLILEQNLI